MGQGVANPIPGAPQREMAIMNLQAIIEELLVYSQALKGASQERVTRASERAPFRIDPKVMKRAEQEK